MKINIIEITQAIKKGGSMGASLETVSFLHTISGWALIGCAALTAIALVLNILTGNILNRDLKLKVAELNSSAREAKERTEKLELKTAELLNKNLETEKELEKEKIKRLEMEKSLEPRSLTYKDEHGSIISATALAHIDGLNRRKSNVDPLKTFKGINVIIEYLPAPEVIRATNSIVGVINFAGWKIIEKTAQPNLLDEYFDGVVIWAYRPSLSTKSMPDKEEENAITWSRGAAASLVLFLKSNNWQADLRAGSEKIPINTIKIMVGFKPNLYFLAQPLKKAKNEVNAFMEETLIKLVNDALQLKSNKINHLP